MVGDRAFGIVAASLYMEWSFPNCCQCRSLASCKKCLKPSVQPADSNCVYHVICSYYMYL